MTLHCTGLFGNPLLRSSGASACSLALLLLLLPVMFPFVQLPVSIFVGTFITITLSGTEISSILVLATALLIFKAFFHLSKKVL